MTNGQLLRRASGGLPLQTLTQVRATIAEAAGFGSAAAMRRLLINHGRITKEAMVWLLSTPAR